MARQPVPALDRPWRRSGAVPDALSRLRGIAKPPITVTDPPADIVVDRDVEIRMCDGTLLQANVFRSADDVGHPVVLSIHPYGKDNLPTRRGKWWTYSRQYRILRQPDPVTFSALTGWEAPGPAWWVAQGFAVVNADLRGCGHSGGTAQLLSQQEGQDTYDVVQWAAGQPWSNGRVVMLEVSYLAITQYRAATLQPPGLRAICPWEGFTDIDRDLAFPGGIREKGFTRIWTLGIRRTTRQAYDILRMQDAHPLRDEFWSSLVPDLSAIRVPMLVCGSFSDNNLHSRGSIRAFTHGGSSHARLYTHRGGKWSTFYSGPARAEQLVFIRAALDGARDARSVRLEVHEDRDTVTAIREESEWPLARTRWRPLYLARPGMLATQQASTPGRITFKTRSRAAAFSWTVPDDIELTGPMAARLWLELHGCNDVNLFVGLEKWHNERFVRRIRRVIRLRPRPGDQRMAARVAARTGSRAVAAMGARPSVHLAAAAARRRSGRGRCGARSVGDPVPRRRAATTAHRRPLVVAAQPIHRPVPGQLCSITARSRHPALGPWLQRPSAGAGNPGLAGRADAKSAVSASKRMILRLLARIRSRRPCRPRPRRRR